MASLNRGTKFVALLQEAAWTGKLLVLSPQSVQTNLNLGEVGELGRCGSAGRANTDDDRAEGL